MTMVGWDADDNGDGHLDDPADDPRHPPDDEPDYRYEQEGERMNWHLSVKQLERTGMWRATADSTGYHFEITAPERDQAVAKLRAQVDAFEAVIGVSR
jgi:hypothetical protein